MSNSADRLQQIRDEIAAAAPSYDEVYTRLNEERSNVRARRYLRDLRRDAVIEFR